MPTSAALQAMHPPRPPRDAVVVAAVLAASFATLALLGRAPAADTRGVLLVAKPMSVPTEFPGLTCLEALPWLHDVKTPANILDFEFLLDSLVSTAPRCAPGTSAARRRTPARAAAQATKMKMPLPTTRWKGRLGFKKFRTCTASTRASHTTWAQSQAKIIAPEGGVGGVNHVRCVMAGDHQVCSDTGNYTVHQHYVELQVCSVPPFDNAVHGTRATNTHHTLVAYVTRHDR